MTTLVWLQREFRLDYLPALTTALNLPGEVIFAYFHDRNRLVGEANTVWLGQALKTLRHQLQQQNGALWIVEGDFETRFQHILSQYNVHQVYYSFQVGEPFSGMQQSALAVCRKQDVKLTPFFSEFWLAPTDIQNQQGAPYLVFTPFYKALMAKEDQFNPLSANHGALSKTSILPVPDDYNRLPESLSRLMATPWAQKLLSHWQIGTSPAWQIWQDFVDTGLNDYEVHRDFPALAATSHLSAYLHFGHLPARQLYFELQSLMADGAVTASSASVWLRQLAWKEFARHLLYWFPHTQTEPFQSKYQHMDWQANESQLQTWQQGQTGIPIIDAGMRELWETGVMHNRVRMLTASFLTKNLNQPWQLGKQWFDQTLLDADPANNTMGWQWVAGCGVDAAPYYRLFNPVTQSRKFDPEGAYLRRWLPELANLPTNAIHAPWEAPLECQAHGVQLGLTYPWPVVDLQQSREAHLASVERLKHLSRTAK